MTTPIKQTLENNNTKWTSVSISGSAPIKQTLENNNTKWTSVSISGPAYMVAVGGAARGSKAKSRKYVIRISKRTTEEECRIASRYLRPSIGSCHDRCKQDMKDEYLGLKKHTNRYASRKMSVMKNKGVERNVMIKTKPEPKTCVRDEAVEVIKQQNLLPVKKDGVSKQSLSANRKSARNERELTKNDVKEKAVSSSTVKGSSQLNGRKKIRGVKRKLVSVERVAPKDHNNMTENKIKQLIAEKVTEMIMHEVKTADLEFVPLTVETIESPATVTTESTNLSPSESSQSSSDKQNLEEEIKDTSNEEVILSEEENDALKLQFRKGKVAEVESEDDDPRKLNFRRGKVLEDNEDEESIARISFKEKVDEERNECESGSETVTLKHQEMQEKKEAQELLNREIEETASKLVVVRKTKVRALVGAFESVISSR